MPRPSDYQLVVGKRTLMNRYDLNEKQIELLRFVMLPKAFRPDRHYICAKIGIIQETYYDWLRSPQFNLARRHFVKEFFKDDIPDILMAMKHEALSGNERAARLFLEFVDDFDNSKAGEDPEAKMSDLILKENKQIIINLTQKFYGDQKRSDSTVEGETEPIISGSADAA